MEVSYLNCGLRRSLKCGILAVFERYVCSNEEDLKNSVLNEIRTLISAMPMQCSTS